MIVWQWSPFMMLILLAGMQSVDNETMEAVVGDMLVARGETLGLAESLTGGLVGSRCAAVRGASNWFRGSIVSYASDVKFSLLGVPEGPVVSADAAKAMAAADARIAATRIEAKGHVVKAAEEAAIAIVARLTGDAVSPADAAQAVKES